MKGPTPDPTPLYAQLEAQIAAGIADGHFPLGTRLPPEDELIRRFNVSRTTVRKAIQNLTARGLIEIRRGTGTFVTLPRITQELTELTGFVEDMQALGHHPTARLLDKTVVPADETVAGHLGLPPATPVMRIQRVRLANGVAVSFDETYLPLAIGEKVVTHDLEAEPIFALLEQRYGITLIEADYRLEAASAGQAVAAALDVATGSPVFLIERTSYSAGMVPVDYEKLFYRGDLIRFTTRLARRKPAET
ncbi:MAG: GntR family transcriptional regulator [Rhodospirillales bacterium 20-64-7]|nr:MAG: GntR family transcriptional regulator [Rhodospirillales bacterium 20-64-7]HQT78478.1 GntR family transcriptional regulator [Rhodopila sp.]